MDQLRIGHIFGFLVIQHGRGQQRSSQPLDDGPRNRIVRNADPDGATPFERLVRHTRRCIQQEGEGPRQILFQQPELSVIHPAIIGNLPQRIEHDGKRREILPLDPAQPLDGLRRTDRAAEGIDAVGRIDHHAVPFEQVHHPVDLLLGRILGIDFNQHREGKYTEII